MASADPSEGVLDAPADAAPQEPQQAAPPLAAMTGRELLRLVSAQVCEHSAMTGARMAAPLLALKLGYSAAAVGVLLALYALAAVFLSIPAGKLADRRGLRVPLILSVLGATSGAAIAAIWPVYLTLCVSALLLGASANTAQIALQRYVGLRATDAAARKLAFSWMAIAPAFANFAGPFLAGLLIDFAGPTPGDLIGYRAAFGVLAVLPLLCWWLIRRVPETPAIPAAASEGPHSVWDLLGSFAMRNVLLANWLQSIAWDSHTFVLPLLGHARGLEASVIGVLMGVFAIAAAVVRVALPAIARRWEEWQVILAGTVLALLALVAYPFTSNAVEMGLCSVVLGASVGAMQPMVLSLLNVITPLSRQGEAMALRALTMSASSFAIPMVFGSLSAVIGAGGVFWVVAAVLTGGLRSIRALGRITPSHE